MTGRIVDASSGRAVAIDACTFAAAMARFEPFEPAPIVAVGVSGGPDSMALVMLVDDWARARGGMAVGVTVDHMLRPASADEARQACLWLGARGVAHHVVRWSGDKPSSGIQSAAREARYRLLAEFCATRGILHLAVAHHADDQAETVLLRRERGSGDEGLAGMAASRSLGTARLIRPVLGWRKASLIAHCAANDQAYFCDPSNTAPRFARTALRVRLAADPALDRAVLAEASEMASRRAEGQRARSEALARAVEIRPDGAAVLDRRALAAQPIEERRAILSSVLRTVGGNAFAPALQGVARLDAALTSEFRGASLAGCLIRRWHGAVLVCRELRAIEPPVELVPGEWCVWDGRFIVCVDAGVRGAVVGALGRPDYATLRKVCAVGLPAIAGASLPALRLNGKLLAVPTIGWAIEGAPPVQLRFTPLWPLSSETFTVVNRGCGIISVTGE